MTIKELYESVAQLGFETGLEDTERFYQAANRALLQINRIRPKVVTYDICHFPLKNLVPYNSFTPIKISDEDIVFVAEKARSYYFECIGNADIIIEKQNADNSWKTILSPTPYIDNGNIKTYKGFILDGAIPFEGVVRIRFKGGLTYYVQNVALYSEKNSNNIADIPTFGKTSKYDISKQENFLALCSPPICNSLANSSIQAGKQYTVESDKILCISNELSGVFTVLYEKNSKPILSEDENAHIDLDDELAALMPLLVSSYIWVEDEPQKAEYYLSLYREQVMEIRARARNLKAVTYKIKNGW